VVRDDRNIDRIFRETLAEAEVDVPDLCWENIEKQVHPKKRIPWNSVFQLAVASLALFLSFAGGYFLSEQKYQPRALAYFNSSEYPVWDDSTATQKNNLNALNGADTNELYKSTLYRSKSAKLANEQTNMTVRLSDNSSSKDKFENSGNSNKEQVEMDKNLNLLSNEMALQYNELEANILEKNKNDNGWLIGGQFTPLYSYRKLRGEEGDLQNEAFDKQENAVVAFSSGFSIQYQNSRWSILSGINYTTYGQSSNLLADAFTQSDATLSNPSKLRLATSAGNIIPESSVIQSLTSSNQDQKEGSAMSPNVYQDFNYIEIPVWVKYKVLDGKIDFNVFGGFNTNLLVNNKVYVEQGTDRILLGTTDNLSPVHYTSTVGLGIEYQLIYNIRFNLEPTFKYSLTPINQNEMIRNYPYAFGIMTGMRFKF